MFSLSSTILCWPLLRNFNQYRRWIFLLYPAASKSSINWVYGLHRLLSFPEWIIYVYDHANVSIDQASFIKMIISCARCCYEKFVAFIEHCLACCLQQISGKSCGILESCTFLMYFSIELCLKSRKIQWYWRCFWSELNTIMFT